MRALVGRRRRTGEVGALRSHLSAQNVESALNGDFSREISRVRSGAKLATRAQTGRFASSRISSRPWRARGSHGGGKRGRCSARWTARAIMR
jgi:hypothetical protein